MPDEYRRVSDQGFHVDKSISVGHIITTLTLAAGLMWWGQSVETRIAIQSAQITEGTRNVARVEREQVIIRADIKENLKEIKLELREINDKVSNSYRSSKK